MNPSTFRWDAAQSVLWAGVRSYPARFRSESLPERAETLSFQLRMETRQATVHFENQWQLSTIWGDATYSSNHWQLEQQPFMEEPTLVEVGVLAPFEFHKPAQSFDLPSGTVEVPETHFSLWGEPLGYVDVPMYHRVADLVMHLPTEIDVPEGEWEDAQGFCDLLITAGLERTL